MTEALDRVRRGISGLDIAGRIVFANRAARSLLAASDALRVEDCLLAANRPDRTAALRRMFRSATLGEAPGALALPRPDGRLPLVLETVPMDSSAAALDLRPPPTVLLLIDDPEDDRVPAAMSLREFYGLTATEAAVAIHATHGKGVGAVARALGIAPNTVRSHLHPPPSRKIARLLMADVAQLPEVEQGFIAHLLQKAPGLAAAIAIAKRLNRLLRRDSQENLDQVLNAASKTSLAEFAAGLRRDLVAVQAALTLPWTTSPAEGQTNQLEMLKRTIKAVLASSFSVRASSTQHDTATTARSTDEPEFIRQRQRQHIFSETVS